MTPTGPRKWRGWTEQQAAASFADFRREVAPPYCIGDREGSIGDLFLWTLCDRTTAPAIHPEALARWPSLFEDVPFCVECLRIFAQPDGFSVVVPKDP